VTRALLPACIGCTQPNAAYMSDHKCLGATCDTISLDHTPLASLTSAASWLADGGPFALDEPPSMRTLTLELCTQPTVDLSGCVNLRALNLTLWKVNSTRRACMRRVVMPRCVCMLGVCRMHLSVLAMRVSVS